MSGHCTVIFSEKVKKAKFDIFRVKISRFFKCIFLCLVQDNDVKFSQAKWVGREAGRIRAKSYRMLNASWAELHSRLSCSQVITSELFIVAIACLGPSQTRLFL